MPETLRPSFSKRDLLTGRLLRPLLLELRLPLLCILLISLSSLGSFAIKYSHKFGVGWIFLQRFEHNFHRFPLTGA